MAKDNVKNKTRSESAYKLLELTLGVLLARMQQTGTCSACGKSCGHYTASAQDISNVLKLLATNGISIDPTSDGDALDAILHEMESKGQGFKMPALTS